MTDREKLEVAQYVIAVIEEAQRDHRGIGRIWVSDWMGRARAILTRRNDALNKSIARLGR